MAGENDAGAGAVNGEDAPQDLASTDGQRAKAAAPDDPPADRSSSRRKYNFNTEPELLSRLLEDGRASMQDLADANEDYYRQKAWRIVKSLEDDVIWGYTAVVDETKLGWSKYMVLAKLNALKHDDLPALRKMIQRIHNDPNIHLKSVNATDDAHHHWILEVAVRSPLTVNNHLLRFSRDLPDLLAEKPMLINLVSTLRESGKDNPDRSALRMLLDTLIE